MSKTLAIGAVCGGLALLGSMVLSVLLSVLGAPASEQEWITSMLERGDGSSAVLLILFIALVPFAEEVFFRGYVFERLRGSLGTVTAYAASSFMFAAIHGNPSAFLVYVFLGLVLAAAYHRSGGIVAPVLAHCMNNAFAFLLLRAGLS